MPTISRRRFIELALLSALGTSSSSGCGTILHPERVGQPPGGCLDWGIVLLDAIGLFFFIIPGVIAFAVDFSNGTIYLPNSAYVPRGPVGMTPPKQSARRRLTSVKVAKADPESIEKVVAERTGRKIKLAPGSFETEELASLNEFWDKHDALADGNGES